MAKIKQTDSLSGFRMNDHFLNGVIYVVGPGNGGGGGPYNMI